MREHAGAHGGVITAARSERLGADATVIRRLLGSGEWCRARRGVYRDPGFVPRLPSPAAAEHHARCAGLIAALGSGVAVSHTSAARLLDLPLPASTPDDMVVTRRPPAPSNRFGAASRVHLGPFDDAEVLEVHGVPVLTGARLVLDCCSVLRPEAALAIADAALRRRLVTPCDLDAELRRRPGRRGARTAALVVDRADPLAESAFESTSRWWLAAAGMPRPVLHQRFTDERGTVCARGAFWLPDHRVVGVADDPARYTQPGALFAERQQEDWLRDQLRVEVVRWGPSDMADPVRRAAVMARFRRAFARQAR